MSGEPKRQYFQRGCIKENGNSKRKKGRSVWKFQRQGGGVNISMPPPHHPDHAYIILILYLQFLENVFNSKNVPRLYTSALMVDAIIF